VKDYGILAIRNIDYVVVYYLQIPNISYMDLIVNPITETKYLGALITQSNNEFFVEINVDSEDSPKLNKLFAHNKLITNPQFVTNDSYFSYIMNQADNTILIIRRGMLNPIPAMSYTLKINFASNLSNFKLISLYNFETKQNYLAFLSQEGNGNLIFSPQIIFPDDSMQCTFMRGGNFTIVLQKYSEACEDSLKFSTAYAFCKLLITLEFSIIGDDDEYLRGVRIGVAIVVVLLVLILIAAGIIRYKLLKDKISKPKPKRQDLYLDDNPMSKDQENDIKRSKYLSDDKQEAKLYN
jgi:hypothetical protein